jgi:hypothetical protein
MIAIKRVRKQRRVSLCHSCVNRKASGVACCVRVVCTYHESIVNVPMRQGDGGRPITKDNTSVHQSPIGPPNLHDELMEWEKAIGTVAVAKLFNAVVAILSRKTETGDGRSPFRSCLRGQCPGAPR